MQGRWALVQPEEQVPETELLADRVADQLLARYGVVFRELFAREPFAVPFREVARALRRKEARGLVRGGRFVTGFVGEQFALPDAVEGLRRTRRTPRAGERVTIAAADPLNLTGTLTPGPRIGTHASARLTFIDGALLETPARDETGAASPSMGSPRLVALPR
jgi:ATP-dependent Lhr-like helicase